MQASQKLNSATDGENYIETVWGRGYVLRDLTEGIFHGDGDGDGDGDGAVDEGGRLTTHFELHARKAVTVRCRSS